MIQEMIPGKTGCEFILKSDFCREKNFSDHLNRDGMIITFVYKSSICILFYCRILFSELELTLSIVVVQNGSVSFDFQFKVPHEKLGFSISVFQSFPPHTGRAA